MMNKNASKPKTKKYVKGSMSMVTLSKRSAELCVTEPAAMMDDKGLNDTISVVLSEARLRCEE